MYRQTALQSAAPLRVCTVLFSPMSRQEWPFYSSQDAASHTATLQRDFYSSKHTIIEQRLLSEKAWDFALSLPVSDYQSVFFWFFIYVIIMKHFVAYRLDKFGLLFHFIVTKSVFARDRENKNKF